MTDAILKHKSQQLSQLSSEIIEACQGTELAREATQFVAGRGNLMSPVIFIGEAPGKQEDEQGQPFVGQSGEVLDGLLASIGLKREDIYITNLVKYRPRYNRDPSQSEKDMFAEFLNREISIIQAPLIVTLGRHAASHFMPGFRISQEHGQIFDLKDLGVKLLALYHPAVALYDRNQLEVLQNDFQTIKQYLQDNEENNSKTH